ncbi:MAG: hypothetical protein KF703_11285 [Actinobacteria bacterium]|nr:hypothetical protein [Actinomycetota bacterium]
MVLDRSSRGGVRRLAATGALLAVAATAQAWAPPASAAADAAQADLSVTVSHSPAAPFTGDPLTFTITAANAGPAEASGVVGGLSLTYPFRYTPAPSPSAAACGVTQETNAVLCSFGTIPAGGSTTVRVVVAPLSAGVFPVTVAVASETPDPDLDDRAATDTVIVQQGPTQIDRAVAAIYELVLDRAATPREVRYWSDAWVNGPWERRYRVPLAIIAGSESRRIRVAEAYSRILGRAASSREVAAWSARLGSGLTYERFEASLVGSGEFARRHPGRTRTIQGAFSAVLSRQPSAGELADWSARLARGTTVGQLAVALYASTEGRDVVITRYFRNSIGRSPTNFDRYFWFSALDEGSTADAEWAKLLVSDQYLSQFPPTYYGPVYD